VSTQRNQNVQPISPGCDDLALGLFAVWRQMGRMSEVVVIGDCMEPTIRKGAKVTVDPSLKEIVPSDIVVFKNGDHLTVHRVVQIIESGSGRSFLTKGDRNNYCDSPVREESILGKVVYIGNP
jgi:signal peptidase I